MNKPHQPTRVNRSQTTLDGHLSRQQGQGLCFAFMTSSDTNIKPTLDTQCRPGSTGASDVLLREPK